MREFTHHSESYPHWSTQVKDWPADRWDDLSSAPTTGSPILKVRGRGENGQIFEDMHRASGDGDGLMPPYDGWFIPVMNDSGQLSSYAEVRPTEWQPLHAGKLISQA